MGVTNPLLHDSEIKFNEPIFLSAEIDFFEGTEKLLEIWFEKGTYSVSLRSVSYEKVKTLLDLVNCTILSKTSNNSFDAYVLSESSLFIYDEKLILKTCGTTSLLSSVPFILDLACNQCALRVGDVFYSHKQFLRPESQPFPHNSFTSEVKFLDKFFRGASYALGRLDGDLWYLYIVNKLRIPAAPKIHLPHTDQTLEIMMNDLSSACASKFFRQANTPATLMTETSGISRLFGDAVVDAFAFDPCGYSCNGLLGNHYFTIHATPQSGSSYASFETNYPFGNYTEIVNQVLQIFQPQRCSISLFLNSFECGSSCEDFIVHGYERLHKQLLYFETYNLCFAQFHKTAPSE